MMVWLRCKYLIISENCVYLFARRWAVALADAYCLQAGLCGRQDYERRPGEEPVA